MPAVPAKSWNTSKAAPSRPSQEREAAQTLFDAKRKPARSRAGLLALLGSLALILCGGGFYVWYSLAFPPSPPLTQQSQPRPQLSPPVQAAESAPNPPAKPAPVATQTPPSTPIAPSAQLEAPTVVLAAPEMVEKPAPAPIAPHKPKAPSRDSNLSASGDSEIAAPPEDIVQKEIAQARRHQSTRRAKTLPPAGPINLGKGNQSGFDADIALAYNSLLSGNRGEAKRLYSIAAERDPFNTDALLGLATIAGNQGDLSGAERYYRRVLDVDPQNSSAVAGLASIRQSGGPSESQLKSELARAPDSAPLQFALGNKFANQGRWDEAQQAYFDAFNLDGANADYAYNLAVSLDQINQTRQAASYYRKALDLAKIHGSHFRPAEISARLAELGQGQ